MPALGRRGLAESHDPITVYRDLRDFFAFVFFVPLEAKPVFKAFFLTFGALEEAVFFVRETAG